MRVEVHLLSQSKPVVHGEVVNAYMKEGMYCLYLDPIVVKYPVCNIFRVKEVG